MLGRQLQDMNNSFPYRVVFLTGVDGSGKTYFTKELIRVLRSKGVPAIHVWSRFNNYLSKPLLALTRLMGLNYYEYTNGIRVGYHDFDKIPVFSWLFIFLQILDVWIANISKFWLPLLRKDTVIIADRGPFDTLVDVMTDTKKFGLGKTFIGRLFTKFIPEPHEVLFISRTDENIRRERPDVILDRAFPLRLKLYESYSGILKLKYVDNNSSVENAMESMKEILKLN
jgi:thymidylate kinase